MMRSTMTIRFTEASLGMVIGCRESDGAALVVTVKEDGAAKRGGARPGMVVTKVNEKHICSFDEVTSLVPTLLRPVTIGFDDERVVEEGVALPSQASQLLSQGKGSSGEVAVARGAVAQRWAAIRAEHEQQSERRLNYVRDRIRADVAQHDLDSIVAERVKYFTALFEQAVKKAMDDTRVLNERDPKRAAAERKRRRLHLEQQRLADKRARRAPRPKFENVAGSPDELVIQVSSPALGPVPARADDRVLYALIDVSLLDKCATARKWTRYERPIRIAKVGTYAVLTKMVPGKGAIRAAVASCKPEDASEDAFDSLLYRDCQFESEVVTAVYELGESPPLMQYEECARELAYVPRREADSLRLSCVKCGGVASADRKLYARGNYCICRACALKGAGVMIDPGARRMWFSQMISFVGNRAIPLPRSQPLLTQILRVMQSHPGMTVRFEGHVNSMCSTSCDGANPCDNPMCKKVPGGAMGLSNARANALKAFVVACGVEEDRVYAVGFAGTRRLTGDIIDEAIGRINRRVEVHTLLC